MLKLFTFTTFIVSMSCFWSSQASAQEQIIGQFFEPLSLSQCIADNSFSPYCKQNIRFSDWDRNNSESINQILEQLDNYEQFRPLLNALVSFNQGKRIRLILSTETAAGLAEGADQKEKDLRVTLSPNILAKMSPARSGLSWPAHVFLHELSHHYIQLVKEKYENINGRWSFWRSFDALMGFYAYSATSPGINWVLVNRLKEKIISNSASENLKHGEDYARTRGFPSIYSMNIGNEVLAELVAYSMYEPSLLEGTDPKLLGFMLETDLFLSKSNFVRPPVNNLFSSADRYGVTLFEYSSVGVLYKGSSPMCTATIIRHGLALTAKHCLIEEQLQPSIFKLAFYSGESLIEVKIQDPSDQIKLDQYDNDFAYISYDPKITEEKIELLNIRPIYEENKYVQGAKIFTVGFPAPERLISLSKVASRPCSLTGARNRQIPKLSDPVNKFQGVLEGTSCPGFYVASGSPVLGLPEKIDGEDVYPLYGVLTHTFDVLPDGEIDISRIQSDWFGSYTKINFSPFYLENDLKAYAR